ncbi:hypothetical protein HS088_TW09G00945 [Tripterygium wilfordii]|uniref:Prolamin-like domain-containing protein n=1 Tax=Tripterygium wilfordii TaxID=458696 RepID=A0A7J7D969_TRIWF|nr:hypothetical protein HS088_TW09G00945 [Tripterygium wilfordii]
MAALSPRRTVGLAILLTLACTTMLLPVGQAKYFPIISIRGAGGCWKAVTSVKGCAVEVVTSLLSGEIGVGPACCTTLIHIEDSCLSKLFPWNPFIPKLKEFCSLRASLVQTHGQFVAVKPGKIGSIGPACCDAITHIQADCWPKLFPSDPVFPKGLKTFCAAPPPLRPSIAKELESELLKDVKEIKQCWSSITSIDGCVAEIFKSFTSGKIGEFGSACCKAISGINDNCWSQIFPIDPFFPPLIKSKCGTNSGVAAPRQ